MKTIFSYQADKTPVLSARFGLSLVSESWDSKKEEWVYGKDLSLMAMLEVMVDEDSGEDGAPAPDAHWHIKPVPDDLFHSTWTDQAPEFEAWFGNDAPELENNRIELKGRQGDGRVLLRWTSECEGESVVVEGPFEFDGLKVTLLDPDDLKPFLKKVWPKLNWSEVRCQELEATDYGPSMPEGRRLWHNFQINFQ